MRSVAYPAQLYVGMLISVVFWWHIQHTMPCLLCAWVGYVPVEASFFLRSFSSWSSSELKPLSPSCESVSEESFLHFGLGFLLFCCGFWLSCDDGECGLSGGEQGIPSSGCIAGCLLCLSVPIIWFVLGCRKLAVSTPCESRRWSKFKGRFGWWYQKKNECFFGVTKVCLLDFFFMCCRSVIRYQ